MKREKRKSPENKQKKTSHIQVSKKQKKTEIQVSSKIFPFNIWILIGLILTIGIIAFSKYLSTESLFFFKDIGSDSINQNYPGIVHKINMMSEGFFSKWSFYKGTGQKYITGFPVEPYGIFRHSIDYIGGSNIGADFFVYGRFIRIFIFDFLLSGIIFYLYLRTLSVKKFSSLVGGLLIAFSGYMVVGSGWGFSAHIFKAAFLLFSFEQLYLKKRWYFFPFAFIWLSSNVFILYVYSVFLLIYSIFRYFSENEKGISNYLKLSGKMILLGAIGLMMNFASIVRSFSKMYYSPRVAGSASYSNVLSSGNEIADQTNIGTSTILRFFSSDILGTGDNFQGWSNYLESPLFYIGLLTLLIFPQVFIYLNKRKKIIFGSFFGFWILTLIFPYLRYAILAFTGDYFRYGFDFFIPFTLLFFAIHALNELDKTFKINYKLLGGTFIVLLIALFFPYQSIAENAINSKIQTIATVFFIFYALLLILMSRTKYKSVGQIGIILLLVIELSYFSHKSYEDRIPITKREFKKELGGYNDGTIEAVNYIKTIDNSLFYRTEKDYQSGSAEHSSLNDALAQGYFGTTSYSSFNQLNYVRFLEETGLIQKGDETATRWLTGLRGNPLLQTFGNVKYHLSKSANPEFRKLGFDSLSRQNSVIILKNRYYLPFGYTYDKYIDSEDFKKLTNYQITGQSLSSIYKDLSRTVELQPLNRLISNIQVLINIEHPDIDSFSNAVTTQLGKEDAELYLMTITKYSVSNFRNQTALLNGFVYEKDFHKQINTGDFEKIELTDTNTLVSASNFNFEIYKEITDKLKQDTLQITNFNHADIKGKISLQKTKMLFFTIPFDKGWKIKVNNKESSLLRINYGFTGVVLPKGDHTIELYYVPQYSKLTNTVSLLTIVGFWLYIGFMIFRKRKLKKKENN